MCHPDFSAADKNGSCVWDVSVSEVIWLAAPTVGGVGSWLAWECRALAFPGNSHGWNTGGRQGTADALTAPGLESKIVFVSFVTTASRGNYSCEMTAIALISVSSCWGYWESIFCFENIMFGFPKQNFEGFLFHENFKCWLTSWFKVGFFLENRKSM